MEVVKKGANFKIRISKNRDILEVGLIGTIVLVLMVLIAKAAGLGFVMSQAAFSSVLLFMYWFDSSRIALKEMTYLGSLDELVKEFARLGIAPSSRAGDTYIFITRSRFLSEKTIFVKDMGDSCELYSLYLDEICELKKKTEVTEG